MYLKSRALPAAAPRGHLLRELLGELLRSLRLHQAPTAARLLLRATPVGRATRLYLAWPHRDELSTSTLPDPVNLFLSSPHLVFT